MDTLPRRYSRATLFDVFAAVAELRETLEELRNEVAAAEAQRFVARLDAIEAIALSLVEAHELAH